MAIYERSEYMVHRMEVRDRNNDKIAATSTISIYDPCSSKLIDEVAYSQDAVPVTGEYLYNYPISSTATYGKYKILTSTTTAGVTTITDDEFYIMPWKVQRDVRNITGASETKDVDDDSLSALCWSAYKEALRDVYIHHYQEKPKCNPDTGAGVDGSNTTFQSSCYPIADINGDGVVTGNSVSCATDITGYWIDNTGKYNRAIIVVNNDLNGEISIYQNDGVTAIPSDYEGLLIDYWVKHRSFDEELFRNAVAHLASDMLIRRLKEIDRVTLGSLSPNIAILTQNSDRFYKKYKQIINKVRKPMVSGT